MTKKVLSIYIFSYNRVKFLANAIESCLNYSLPFDLTIIDDNSSDPETKNLLRNLPDKVALIQPLQEKNMRHGGLYNNMQMALESSKSDWVLFIQDDMQLVRPLEEDDYQYIEGFFQQFPKRAFLNPVFLKGQRHKRNQRITYLNNDFPCYFRNSSGKKHQTGFSYTDVFLAHRTRLLDKHWVFSLSENENSLQAKEKFGLMGFMASPFVMYLPQVPVYRGKYKTLAVKLAEKWSGSDPKSFIEKNKNFWNQFKSRDLNNLPTAENYLECIDKEIKKPYQYSTVNNYIFLRVIHKFELLWNSIK